jgi:predicted homoserine dehydrogenase-like protein
LNLYKLGEGPLYSFYTPWHLCHFEVPLSVGRVVLFDDPVIQPFAGPRVDVIATAKTDLRSGTVLDGIGGYHTYGEAENSDVVLEQRLLPMGLAEGCRLLRDVKRDEVLTYDDVALPAGRLCDELRAQQDARFFGVSGTEPVHETAALKTADVPVQVSLGPRARPERSVLPHAIRD